MKTLPTWSIVGIISIGAQLALSGSEESERDLWPVYLRDRGPGVATSEPGTYLRQGQWLVHPFYEFESKSATEYQGSELGFEGDETYLGRSNEIQAMLLVAYGVTPDLVVELESTLYRRAILNRAADDTTSGMPERIRESGSGAVEAEVRWRVARETERRPEFFANVEVGPPVLQDQELIGNSDWEVEVGLGAAKGLRWGTVTARASLAFEVGDGSAALGEYAVEYFSRLSERWNVAAAVEGENDQLTALGELQWRYRRDARVRINVGFGLTEFAPDYTIKLGVAFAL